MFKGGCRYNPTFQKCDIRLISVEWRKETSKLICKHIVFFLESSAFATRRVPARE